MRKLTFNEKTRVLELFKKHYRKDLTGKELTVIINDEFGYDFDQSTYVKFYNNSKLTAEDIEDRRYDSIARSKIDLQVDRDINAKVAKEAREAVKTLNLEENKLKWFEKHYADKAKKQFDPKKNIKSIKEASQQIIDITDLHYMNKEKSEKLYNLPIVTVKKIEEWTGLSRPQANELTKKMVELEILKQINKKIEYRRQFWYKNYLDLFISE